MFFVKDDEEEGCQARCVITHKSEQQNSDTEPNLGFPKDKHWDLGFNMTSIIFLFTETSS